MIYFDNASTTKVFDEAAKAMSEALTREFYNPSALYAPALAVKNLMESARQTVARQMNAMRDEIYFTSCATESNNWALNCGFKNKKGNLVVSKGEHASVYESAMSLKSKGYDVRFVELAPDGTISLSDFDKKVDENTSLVSVIHCSNETGVINDIKEISRITKAKSKRALIHCDGVQAFCKLDSDVKGLGVDFYTVSAHKIGGPKGCGALYINGKVNITPYIVGGGQERGLRSGTENIAAIIGFSEAILCYAKYYDRHNIWQIHDYILKELTENGWIHNGTAMNSGFVLSLSMPGIKSEILAHMLSDEGILIGLGSACSSKTSENRVLSAIGRSAKEIEGNIRISLGLSNTMDDARTVTRAILANIEKIKARKVSG